MFNPNIEKFLSAIFLVLQPDEECFIGRETMLLFSARTVKPQKALHIGFQKRHLFAHKMGVIDQAYLNATGEPASLLGHKVSIKASEVK